MARLNRRDFLKALGLGGASAAAAACHLDDNRFITPIEQVLPYIVKPEQVTPGMPTFFATTIGTGPSAWPVLGRHRDGRVVHVSANTRAPRPAAAPKGTFLELQKHYSPDRLRSPQSGGADISWDDALTKLADAVKAAHSAGKAVAYVGPYRSGAYAELIRDYTGGKAVFWEPLGYGADAQAWQALTGTAGVPRYDLSQARYILSFGAPFLGGWGGAGMAAGWSKAKDPNNGHWISRQALVSPHLDQTGANADDWFPVAAGAELHTAFYLAGLVAEKKGYTGPLKAVVDAIDMADALSKSGLDKSELEGLASHFADAKHAVALPGATPDVDMSVACYLLNIVAGNLGHTLHADGYGGPVSSNSELEALLTEMKGGAIGVLLLDDINPVYNLPTELDVAGAFAKCDLVVGLSGHPDESNAAAGLQLNCASPFEDWGDEDVDGTLSLIRQPVMSALWGSRSLGDVLLASARAAGLSPLAAAADPTDDEAPDTDAPAPLVAALGFEPATFMEYVQARWKRDFWPNDGDFRAWWEARVADGFLAHHNHVDTPAFLSSYRFAGRDMPQGTGLVLYADAHRFDGRWSNQPWAQEVADPMTGCVWDSWVNVSPDLAKTMGLSDKDEVTVTTPAGSVTLGVEVYRGLAPNTLAIAFGQGHTANGTYANTTGQNAATLLGLAKDGTGNLLMQPGLATIAKTGNTAHLVSTVGGDSDGGRNLGVTVSADELAKVGDAPQAHGGELTGIHHLPLDPRLVKAGITDFYPAPEHPTYRFAMTVDTNSCNGCGDCVVACYAENNLPVVGKEQIYKGREMNWLRVNRFWESTDTQDHDVRFVPTMCQQCGHAPCESVCPVIATYHNLDGLNAMIYNRCVGTRYCANNCPYLARRFNFHSIVWPEPFNLQLNPDITVRSMGVMEKCTFCAHRIRDIKSAYRDQGVDAVVPDAALKQLPACAEACASQAITFGNKNDPESTPAKSRQSARSWVALAELNTFSAVNYLAKASYNAPAPQHGGGHGDSHANEPAADHGEAAPDAGHGHEHQPSETEPPAAGGH